MRGAVVTPEKARQPSLEQIADSGAVLSELDRILAAPQFQHSKRYPAFLRYITEQTLRGAGEELKERIIGVAVFNRQPDYDTGADPVVRNTASEVRKRLESYYLEPGRDSELRIALPVGAYVPEFRLPIEIDSPFVTGPPEIPVAMAHPNRRRRWAVGISLLAAVALGGFEVLGRKPALEQFWAPLLEGR